MRSTIRSTLTLLALCVSAAGCTTLEYLVTGKDHDARTAPRSITTCPAHPALSVTRAPTGYHVGEADMRALLHYITDLEYALGCER